MHLMSMHRHPVKGLQPETLNSGILVTGFGLEGDRGFAFQFMDSFEPRELKELPAETAPWIFKSHLAVQHDWPDLAQIRALWDSSRRTLQLQSSLTSSGPRSVDDLADRQALAHFVETFLKSKSPFEKAKHPEATSLRLIGRGSADTRYTDSARGPVSIALRESVEDLEARWGFAVDEKRFRLNLFLSGAPAWSELTWVDRHLKIGRCLLKVYKPIARCPNIDVHVETGVRENEIFPQMKIDWDTRSWEFEPT